MFESIVEGFDEEIKDMTDNIIPYWRKNYIGQIKCTDNFKSSYWGTKLTKAEHHQDHILSNVISTEDWNTTSIVEGS